MVSIIIKFVFNILGSVKIVKLVCVIFLLKNVDESLILEYQTLNLEKIEKLCNSSIDNPAIGDKFWCYSFSLTIINQF